jgi:hypothetical protein
MNFVLWVLQALLSLLCIAGGAFQLFKLDELEKSVAAMRALPHALWGLFGAINCLGGLGLLLPGILKMPPRVTAFSAAVVAALSIVISALYVYYGDRPPLSYSVAMAAMAGVIAIGRLQPKPL